MAQQGLQLLTLNRLSRIDTSKHLGILLDYGAFNTSQIGENAKLLLKFVKMTERVDQEKDHLRISDTCLKSNP